MEITQREKLGVATARYWRAKRKSFLLGLLVLTNLVGLAILGLYVTENLPYEVPVTYHVRSYSLQSDSVVVDGTWVQLNGESMNLVEDKEVTTEAKPDYVSKMLQVSFATLGLFLLIHLIRATSYGRRLMEEEIHKEKVDEHK